MAARRIAWFWGEISERADELYRAFVQKPSSLHLDWQLRSWVDSRVRTLHRNLQWDFQHERDEGAGGVRIRFVLLPEDPKMRCFVNEVLREAPTLPRWKWAGFRAGRPFEEVLRTDPSLDPFDIVGVQVKTVEAPHDERCLDEAGRHPAKERDPETLGLKRRGSLVGSDAWGPRPAGVKPIELVFYSARDQYLEDGPAGQGDDDEAVFVTAFTWAEALLGGEVLEEHIEDIMVLTNAFPDRSKLVPLARLREAVEVLLRDVRQTRLEERLQGLRVGPGARRPTVASENLNANPPIVRKRLKSVEYSGPEELLVVAEEDAGSALNVPTPAASPEPGPARPHAPPPASSPQLAPLRPPPPFLTADPPPAPLSSRRRRSVAIGSLRAFLGHVDPEAVAGDLEGVRRPKAMRPDRVDSPLPLAPGAPPPIIGTPPGPARSLPAAADRATPLPVRPIPLPRVLTQRG